MYKKIYKAIKTLMQKFIIKYSAEINVHARNTVKDITREYILNKLSERVVIFTDIVIDKETDAIGVVDTQLGGFFEVIAQNTSEKIIFTTNRKVRVKTKITAKLVEFAAEASWFRITIEAENAENIDLSLTVFIWRYGNDLFPGVPGEGLYARSGEVLARYLQPLSAFTEKTLPESGKFSLPGLHKHRLITRINFPIDIVYTWVNHADAGWQKLIAPYRKPENTALSQYYNSDELKYSMRSVHQNAPWVRKIFVLTNCAPPAWLKPSEKIVWVDHADVFQPEHLPCFNSHVIASYLGNIPELSEHFIYFNDDAFIGRPLQPNFFFDPNGCSISYMGSSIIGRCYIKSSKAYMKSARNAKLLLEKYFGVSPHMQHIHTPSAICKNVLLEMIDRFINIFNKVRRNKFRCNTDISAISFMYHNYAYITRRTIFSKIPCKHILIQDRNFDEYIKFSGNKYDIIGLNDGEFSNMNDEFQIFKRRYMEENFPVLPYWEKAD